jgi:Protein of unknown function (DUF3305)
MIEERLTVGLVVECRALSGPWGGHAWRPVTIFPSAPEVAPWTPLGGSAVAKRYYAGVAHIHLYSTDTTNYRDNLESGMPKLWVVLRPDGSEPPVEVVVVTADPAEGEANTEAGSNVVETIDMPGEIAAFVADFIAAHHVERPIIKRKRDRAEPEVKWRIGAPGSGRKEGGQS